ncbi:hypothetical protein GH733_001643 [Mirounga leonina]|nr:hypothetical protein GH733_004748 [Mirounga leonina]KAF3830775.1 hypothetical protein GH733_001643 [Mirounga leonina]
MEFRSARRAILRLLRTVTPADLPALLEWMRTTRDFDEFTQDNNDIMLKNIAEDLRNCLPLETMLSSEHVALQKIQQQPEPTVHVDAFLYDEDFIDSLCEEGKMSRNYCMINIQLSSWVEEVPLTYDVYPEKHIDREALEQIHLYKIL